jgi:hypothetical protein
MGYSCSNLHLSLLLLSISSSDGLGGPDTPEGPDGPGIDDGRGGLGYGTDEEGLSNSYWASVGRLEYRLYLLSGRCRLSFWRNSISPRPSPVSRELFAKADTFGLSLSVPFFFFTINSFSLMIVLRRFSCSLLSVRWVRPRSMFSTLMTLSVR